jgi:PKD repeat protein
MISKEFVVKLQARADFIANDVCEGDDVVFTNKSEVAAGNLDYEWRFGGQDANGMSTSSLTSPRHNYVLNEGGVTESFRVTLLAIVPGGCSDSIAKTVTVNAAPDAGFSVARSGREITCTPDENDNSNMYNWRFGDGGRSTDIIPTYNYSTDVETFEVCLAIQNNAGCWSEECDEVTIDLVNVENVKAEDIFSVYPNPTSGVFNVNLTEAMDIVIMDATGKTIETVSASGSGVYTIDLSDRAAGVYMVQVTNGNISAMQRVTVAK